MTGQEKKEKVIALMNDLKSDSKTKSKNAEKEIISLCEPVIKKHYEIAKEFGLTSGSIGDRPLDEWDNDYVASRGSIDKIVDHIKGTSIEFYYSDGCRGNIYEAFIDMPLDWLNAEDYDYESYRRHCKLAALERQEQRIKNARADLIKMEEEYKRLQKLP